MTGKIIKPEPDLQADVLVITPHPDDAEFGVAGSVARWVKEGREVIYVVCTNGNKGTGDPSVSPSDLASRRKEEQHAAARLLGVKEVIFLDYEDQALEDTPEFRKEIVRWIRTVRPDTIVTADPYRRYIWHRDHRITGQVVLDAAFPYARDHLAYPDFFASGLMPHKAKEILLWASEDPNYHSDITGTMEVKLAALRCHDSQVGEKFASIEQWVRRRAADAARDQDYDFAESFHRAEMPS
ncbi:MAG: PIG-L deacetylase family protein [Bacillota bacterium]|nr:PIG-L deacetylase family protein [Bacillota bacterium]